MKLLLLTLTLMWHPLLGMCDAGPGEEGRLGETPPHPAPPLSMTPHSAPHNLRTCYRLFLSPARCRTSSTPAPAQSGPAPHASLLPPAATRDCSAAGRNNQLTQHGPGRQPTLPEICAPPHSSASLPAPPPARRSTVSGPLRPFVGPANNPPPHPTISDVNK